LLRTPMEKHLERFVERLEQLHPAAAAVEVDRIVVPIHVVRLDGEDR
jgi:hypothetical protein